METVFDVACVVMFISLIMYGAVKLDEASKRLKAKEKFTEKIKK